jgi:ABC-type multidrug transport system fused ATPase/permease subunit
MKDQPKPKAKPRPAGVLLRGILLLSPSERLSSIGILALLMFAGLFESIVVGLVLPIVYVLVDPEKLSRSSIVQRFVHLAGVSDLAALFPWLVGLIMLALVVSAVFMGAANHLAEVQSARSRDRLATQLVTDVIAAPYLWLTNRNSAVLARQIEHDVRSWRREFIYSLLGICQSAIMIIAPASVAIAIAPGSGLMALAAVGLISAGVVYVFRRRIRNVSQRAKRLSDATSKSLLQILVGIREIKVSGNAQYFINVFAGHHRQLNEAQTQARAWGNAPAALIMVIGQIGFLTTSLILYASGLSGAEVVVQLALIGVVVSRILPAFNRLANQVGILFRSAPFVASLLALIDDVAAARAASAISLVGKSVPDGWTTLSLDRVSFRYPGAARNSLDKVSLTLDRGRFYGFVGRSGAGKSTLVNLLLGLIEPTEGTVRVDAQPLRDITISDWHHRFGYVPQDVFLQDATLRDNIAFGSAADDAEIIQAVRKARLGDLVDSLPAGLDTLVGERGRRFSGGQMQRLAVARAVYKKPEILLLDEATGALDSVTEREIQTSLDELKGVVLALIIAHRVTTLRNCDRIFVLENAGIVDQGTFNELMERSTEFRALAAAQEEETAQAAPDA